MPQSSLLIISLSMRTVESKFIVRVKVDSPEYFYEGIIMSLVIMHAHSGC